MESCVFQLNFGTRMSGLASVIRVLGILLTVRTNPGPQSDTASYFIPWNMVKTHKLILWYTKFSVSQFIGRIVMYYNIALCRTCQITVIYWILPLANSEKCIEVTFEICKNINLWKCSISRSLRQLVSDQTRLIRKPSVMFEPRNPVYQISNNDTRKLKIEHFYLVW